MGHVRTSILKQSNQTFTFAGRTRSNTSILDAHTFNIIVNPTDIYNIIERVWPAKKKKKKSYSFILF